jgi:hypothetical protein
MLTIIGEIFKITMVVILFIVMGLPILMFLLCVVEQFLMWCGIECKMLNIFNFRNTTYTELTDNHHSDSKDRVWV